MTDRDMDTQAFDDMTNAMIVEFFDKQECPEGAGASLVVAFRDFRAAVKAHRLFGNQWRSAYSRIEPFSAGGRCDRRGCPSLTARRIMCNVRGSVAEYDACDADAVQYHGAMLDESPFFT